MGYKKVNTERSIGYYIVNELNIDLNKIWNYEKNNKLGINPWDISRNSHTKVWLFCQHFDYHNDFGGYEVSCNKFYCFHKDGHCSYCNNGKLTHPKDSFAQHGIDIFGNDFLEKYWSSYNTLNPWEIPFRSNKKVWLYCQNNDKHNYDRNNNRIGYEIKCDGFWDRKGCSYCGNTKTHWSESIGYLQRDFSKQLSSIKRNNITLEDCYSISLNSNKKFFIPCLKCGNISTKRKSLYDVNYYSCEFCSDGISIPNKWIQGLLKQLDIKYIPEYSPYYFRKSQSVDIFIPSMNLIIEMDGGRGNHTKEYDCWRDFLNMKYGGYKTIRVDLKDNYTHNEFICLKEQTVNSLSNIFDLSNIDWDTIWKSCQCSKLIESCEMWNDGIAIKDISLKLGINRNTVSKYLQTGNNLNLCIYSKEEAIKRASKLKEGKSNKSSSSVICLTTKKIFHCQNDAMKEYNIPYNGISGCCRGDRRYCGKLKDGTKLVWRYVKWNHNKKYRINK